MGRRYCVGELCGKDGVAAAVKPLLAHKSAVPVSRSSTASDFTPVLSRIALTGTAAISSGLRSQKSSF